MAIRSHRRSTRRSGRSSSNAVLTSAWGRDRSARGHDSHTTEEEAYLVWADHAVWPDTMTSPWMIDTGKIELGHDLQSARQGPHLAFEEGTYPGDNSRRVKARALWLCLYCRLSKEDAISSLQNGPISRPRPQTFAPCCAERTYRALSRPMVRNRDNAGQLFYHPGGCDLFMQYAKASK